MPVPKPFREVQHQAIDDGFLDLLGESQSDFKKVELTDTINTLVQVAAQYVAKLTAGVEQKDVASSGKLSDSIQPTKVEIFGTTYTVGIEALKYADFQDEGVDGWAKDQGSPYKFKTKGVDPKGEMVKSIKDWLKREGSSAKNVKQGISSRETKGKQILDAETKAAVTVAYMIKRQGIKPTHFWRDATDEMAVVIRNEFGKALRIDIINNLKK